MDLSTVIQELESKIVKALDVINELRIENNSLQETNKTLRSQNENYKFSLQEKEDKIKSMIFEMEKNQDEVNQLRLKEETLEVKVNHLLEKFTDIPQTGKLSKPVGFQTLHQLPDEEENLNKQLEQSPETFDTNHQPDYLENGIEGEEDDHAQSQIDKVNDLNLEANSVPEGSSYKNQS